MSQNYDDSLDLEFREYNPPSETFNIAGGGAVGRVGDERICIGPLKGQDTSDIDIMNVGTQTVRGRTNPRSAWRNDKNYWTSNQRDNIRKLLEDGPKYPKRPEDF